MYGVMTFRLAKTGISDIRNPFYTG